MPQRTLSTGLLVAVTLAGVSHPLRSARAADLDYNFGDAPPPVAETKVEFGTGWYVRGDIGATAIPKITAGAPGIPSSASGEFVDNPPSIQISNAHKLGYTASVGGGYAFTKWFRADAVFDFHQPISSSFQGAPFGCQNGFGLIPGTSTPNYTVVNGQVVSNNIVTPASYYETYGTCTGTYKASLKSYDVLVNAYIDIGHWYGLTPYVGAGIGLSFGHYATSSTYTQADGSSYNIMVTNPVSNSTYHIFYDRSASGEYYNFAFALMAGVSYDIFDHTKLDVGYRYLHLGQVLGQELTTQEVRAGLRYMIDN